MARAPRKPSILLVDDEPEILFSLQGLLRKEFDLHTAESGKQALEILDQKPIDIIMTDQRMPGMTGIELMRIVRTKYPESIRIVFTGYADIKAVIDAINSGGLFRYITKPWDPDDLLEILHEAVASHDASENRQQLLHEVDGLLRGIAEATPGRLTEFATQARELLPKLTDVMNEERVGQDRQT